MQEAATMPQAPATTKRDCTTPDEEIGKGWREDHLPPNVRRNRLGAAPRLKQSDMTLDPQTYVYTPKKRMEAGPYTLIVRAGEKMGRAVGQNAIEKPAIVARFNGPGKTYTVPLPEDLEPAWYDIYTSQLDKGEAEAGKLALVAAERDVRFIKWRIETNADYLAGWIKKSDDARKMAEPDKTRAARQYLALEREIGADAVQALLAKAREEANASTAGGAEPGADAPVDTPGKVRRTRRDAFPRK